MIASAQTPRPPLPPAHLPALPEEEDPRFNVEWAEGVRYVSPRPAMPHATASSRLGMILTPYSLPVGGPGGWYLVFEPELHFGTRPKLDILIPDLAGWRLERCTHEMLAAPNVRIAPDWVCETLSPSTAHLDRRAKRRVYAREKVPFVWLLNPLEKTIEVLHLNERGYYEILDVYSPEADGLPAEQVPPVPVDLPPFAGLRLDLLFAPILPGAPEPAAPQP